MKTLAELHTNLTTSAELQELLKSVAREIHNRNVFPLHARAMYAGDDLNNVTKKVRGMMQATDVTSQSSISGGEYRDFRHALWFGDEDDQFNMERSLSMVLAYLLHKHWPGIDDYTDRLDDTDLAKRLGLAVDDEGLIELTDDMELRKHALVLPKRDIMIYPHQFLRRFYGSNFVYMPAALAYCKTQGHTVRLRIDPYRQTLPQYYREIFEADHWYGPMFSEESLRSKDKKPIRTVHFAPENDRLQITYPLGYTVFRSDMMDESNRQFIVEEYVPLASPWASGRSVPGAGDKFFIQKFAHFVYDQNSESFSHIDGAVRAFTTDEYARVFNSVKTGSDPGKKVGKRRKLFKVSGSIDLETVQNLLYEFFRYNPHLGEFFATKEAVEAYLEG